MTLNYEQNLNYWSDQRDGIYNDFEKDLKYEIVLSRRQR